MNKGYDTVMNSRREIVDLLLAQMEKGYAATRKLWSTSVQAYNPVSGATYKGGNRLRLMVANQMFGFTDPRWMTFEQAQEINCRVAAGSKSILLEKWIFEEEVPKLDENGQAVIGENGEPEVEKVALKYPKVNYFRVFNGSQIIGLPELETKEIQQDDYAKMADTLEKSSLCQISYENQNQAYYSPKEDKIHLPLKEAFKSNETRLSVLLHEMSHSTGHENRLDRKLDNSFQSEDYAKEELNAELGAVFMENELGVRLERDGELIIDHSNYLKSWMKILKNDPNELFRAAQKAEKITWFLMKNYQSHRQAQEMCEQVEALSNQKKIESEIEEEIEEELKANSTVEEGRADGVIEKDTFDDREAEKEHNNRDFHIHGFEEKDMVYMAKFTYDGKDMKSGVWKQGDDYYISVGSKVKGDLFRHYLTHEEKTAYTAFVAEKSIEEPKKGLKTSNAKEMIESNRREVADYLVGEMKKGYEPLRAAWSTAGRPYNPISNEKYVEGNRFRLMLEAVDKGFRDPRWMTFEQAKELNYKIASGAKGVLLEKEPIWNKLVPKLDENQKAVIGADGQPEMEKIHLEHPIRKYEYVFNGSQVVGLPELVQTEPTEDIYKKIADIFEKSSECPIAYENVEQAFYSETEDKIHLPLKDSFQSNEERLSVLLYEMSHSTGHPSRLDRLDSYCLPDDAEEKLIVELGTAFMENELGVSLKRDDSLISNGSKHVEGWMTLLKNKPDVLFAACDFAERNAKFLIERYEKQLMMEQDAKIGEIPVSSGDIKYYIRNNSGEITYYNSFETALDVYLKNKKAALGISAMNHLNCDLAWFDIGELKHILSNASIDVERLLPDAPNGIKKTLKVQNERLMEVLQKWNVASDVLKISADIRCEATSAPENMYEMEARLVNAYKSEKYFSLRFLKLQEESIFLEMSAIHGDHLVDTHSCPMQLTDKGKIEFAQGSAEEGIEWIHKKMEEMKMPFPAYGQSAFEIFGSYKKDTLSMRSEWGYPMKEHCKRLEKAGYKTQIETSEILDYKTFADRSKNVRWERICEDVRCCGFEPSNLSDKIYRFEQLEKREYTLRELAELNRAKADFSDCPEKKELFDQIVNECREQELQRIENVSFLKKEMQMELAMEI